MTTEQSQVTAEQRQELVKRGYEIEDMTAANGPGWWDGMFRWMHDNGDFQDHEPSPTEDDAWRCAAEHAGMVTA